MKNNILEYKGYHTKVEYIASENILYGKIEGINDLVTFEASDLNSVEKEFHDAVDDYLAFCEDIGQAPEKEYKGLFNVRIKPELHRQLSLEADKEDITMNALIERILSDYFNPPADLFPQQVADHFKVPSDWKWMMSSSPSRPIVMDPNLGRYIP